MKTALNIKHGLNKNMIANPVTEFAPAQRSDKRTIEEQKTLIAEYYGPLTRLYDAVIEIILIVNRCRQIVFFNSNASEFLNFDKPEDIYGMRPGEAIRCIHAFQNEGGCGTSDHCSQCGAVNAVLSAINKKNDMRECRLLTERGPEALDLLIRATPMEIAGQPFIIIALADISHEKRRRALERIFFHDIMNTAASIKLFSDILNNDPDGHDTIKYRNNLSDGLNQLIDEIRSQKELLSAENEELKIKMQPVNVSSFIGDIINEYKNRFPDHNIISDYPQGNIIVNTDRTLLHRVLGNMIRNALESSKPEESVKVTFIHKEGHIEFSVHNKAYIPRDIQLQLFKRSFSTKGEGRGLGTYSMKLLCEKYLNGSITFHSSPVGTTFTASIPL